MLNVTVDESIAAQVHRIAAASVDTISSIAEKALADHLDWEQPASTG